MSNKEEQLIMWNSAIAEDPEIPAWKSLDIVIRRWAALSGFEKDQSNYQKMKEEFQ